MVMETNIDRFCECGSSDSLFKHLSLLCFLCCLLVSVLAVSAAWTYPDLPDCSALAAPDTIAWEGCVDDPVYIPLNMTPEDSVRVQFILETCSEDCCPPNCASPCYNGQAMAWDILDQNGHQLNHDADVVDGVLTGEMTDRGSIGDCGHPTEFKVAKLHGTNIIKTQVLVEKVSRIGWNQAGTSNETASDVGTGGSWCGSSNRWSECDPPHTWAVTLGTADTLLVSARFTPNPDCSSVKMSVYDHTDQHVQTLFTEYVCSTEVIYHTYIHQDSPGIHYIKLGGVPGGGGDLWAYAISFAVHSTLSGVPGDDIWSSPHLQIGSSMGAGRTEVRYSIRAFSPSLTLKVFDLSGKRVRLLYSGVGEVGDHCLFWDQRDGFGHRVPSGVYLIRLQTTDGSRSVKACVLR
jgi:hypothetical protein